MPTKRREWWALRYPDGRLSLDIDGKSPALMPSKKAALRRQTNRLAWHQRIFKAIPVRVRIEVVDEQD